MRSTMISAFIHFWLIHILTNNFLANDSTENFNMPTYKLTYFNFQGLGEPIRLIFAYAGVQYEDVRIEMDQWPELKPS